jgi:hypothetical protein
MNIKFDFDTWWQTPNQRTGHPPSAILDEYTARTTWEAAMRSLSVDVALQAAEDICRNTVEYEANSGDINAYLSAEAIKELRLAVSAQKLSGLPEVNGLKPCPLCGNAACRSDYDTFGCRNCEIWMRKGQEDKWNTRAAAFGVPASVFSSSAVEQGVKWHAPGMGEVHHFDHLYMIDCQREIDHPDQDYVADDALAMKVCAALNAYEGSGVVQDGIIRKISLKEAAEACESLANGYDHGDAAAIHSRACASVIRNLSNEGVK